MYQTKASAMKPTKTTDAYVMVTAVTGMYAGIENKTIKAIIQTSATTFTIGPTIFPQFHCAVIISLRLLQMEIAIGIAYEAAKDMTLTETKELKADDEPKLIKPSSSCTTAASIAALSGVSVLGLTFANHRERGMPSSRAKAHVVRETAVVIEIQLSTRMIRVMKEKAKPAPGESRTTA
jgi:hypothetical protein